MHCERKDSPSKAGVLHCEMCGTPALELGGPLVVDENESRNGVHGLLCELCWTGVQWARTVGPLKVLEYFDPSATVLTSESDLDA